MAYPAYLSIQPMTMTKHQNISQVSINTTSTCTHLRKVFFNVYSSYFCTCIC